MVCLEPLRRKEKFTYTLRGVFNKTLEDKGKVHKHIGVYLINSLERKEMFTYINWGMFDKSLETKGKVGT